MADQTTQETAFGREADDELRKFYDRFGAQTIQHKINALETELGGPSNFYAFGGEISDDMKLGCLEYEFLVIRGLVDLVLV